MKRTRLLIVLCALRLVLGAEANAQPVIPGTNFVFLVDGTAANPSRTYLADRDLGSYRIGADNEGFTAGGVLRWDYNTTTFTSTLNHVTTGTGPHSIGGASSTDTQLLLAGAFTSAGSSNAFGYRLASTLTPGANDGNVAGLWLAPTFVETAGGTHPRLAVIDIESTTVTSGAAAVTNTAALYIAEAMSATVTGANYAIWSDAGLNRFDGPVITGSQSVDLDGVTTFTATSSYIVLTCTGAETLNTITITGVATGTILDVEHGDTDCTIADDEDPTAANAIDLAGAATDVGAVNKIITLRRHSGGYWVQLSESVN